MKSNLDKEALLEVLRDIAERAKKRDAMIEFSVYGGTVMVIEYEARKMTRDVDVVIHRGASLLRAIVDEIAREKEWDPGWLNDGVKGFISSNPQFQEMFTIEEDGCGLRVLRPTPEYLFAMKAMAMRGLDSENSSDIEDIRFLVKSIGIKSFDEAADIVASFYPKSKISPKTTFGLQELLENILGPESVVQRETGHEDRYEG